VNNYNLLVNGKKYSAEALASTPLANVLRDQLGLRGTKIGCGQGECGACSVMIDKKAVCSCLTPVCRVGERSVTTIEGIAAGDVLHPVQQAFIDHGALQCGFCTPGMVVAACALLAKNPSPSEQDVVDGLTGNLCRCTGYRKIIEAVLDAAARMKTK
jgi:carbon-monoxide dehydrogenase small subunit